MEFENNVTSQEESIVPPTQPEELSVAELPIEAPAEEAASTQFELNVPQDKPKKKTGLILGIVAVAAAVALALGLIFGLGGRSNDPHTAMIAAQQEALYSLVDVIAAGRNNLAAVGEATTGTANQGTLHLLLSESILDRLELLASQYGAELDLSFLQDIAISIDLSHQDQLFQYKLGLGLGDKQITYLDYIMDIGKGALYLGFPELSPNYAATEGFSTVAATTTPQVQQFREAYETFIKSLPSQEALRSCLRSYADLMLEQLKNPTISEEAVTVDGVTQTLTSVTYRLTEAQLLEFLKASLEKLKADETVKQFLEAYIDYVTTAMEGAGDTPEMHFESYEDALQQALTELDQMISEAKDGNYIDLTGYLDQKQTLRGYKMAPYGEDVAADQWLRWITLEDGDKELVEIAIREKEETLLAVTGTQKVKDSIYNGIFKLTFPERRSLTVELIDMTMDPFLKGSIQLTPNTNLMKEIAGDSYTTLRLLGANLGLRLNIEGGAKTGSVGFHFTADGSSLVGITMDASSKPNESITLPEESQLLTGEDAMDQLLAGLDLEKLLKKLEAAGVPSDLIDLLEVLVLAPEEAA